MTRQTGAASLFCLLIAGCTATGEAPGTGPDALVDGGGAGEEGASTDGGATTDDAGADGGTDQAGTAGITGAVADPNGALAAGVRVTLCHGVCRYVDTDDSGSFSFSGVDPQRYALDVTLLGDDSLARSLFMVDLSADTITTLDSPIPMARLGARQEVDAPGEVQLADGLWVSVDPAGADIGGDAPLSMAVGIPATLAPVLPVDADQVLALWYLDPFDTRVDSGMTLRVTNTWGLAPGDSAHALVASYADYDWLDGGTLTVSADGSELTGGELPVISTVLLVAD